MSDSYILELKLNTKKQSDCNYLDNYFHEAWCYSNTLTRIVRKKFNLLKRDPVYISLIKEYRCQKTCRKGTACRYRVI